MKLNRKADLSINLIIVAIIALLVLIVTVFIFSGKMKIFGQGTDSCASKGGTCTDSANGVYAKECIAQGTCSCPDSISNAIFIQGTDCESKNQICCKQVF